MEWTIEYHPCDGNDPDPEEYWIVTDGNLEFKCEDKDGAEWLAEVLNLAGVSDSEEGEKV